MPMKYTGKLVQLKRMGEGSTTHFDVISNNDLQKISSLPIDNPDSI